MLAWVLRLPSAMQTACGCTAILPSGTCCMYPSVFYHHENSPAYRNEHDMPQQILSSARINPKVSHVFPFTSDLMFHHRWWGSSGWSLRQRTSGRWWGGCPAATCTWSTCPSPATTPPSPPTLRATSSSPTSPPVRRLHTHFDDLQHSGASGLRTRPSWASYKTLISTASVTRGLFQLQIPSSPALAYLLRA